MLPEDINDPLATRCMSCLVSTEVSLVLESLSGQDVQNFITDKDIASTPISRALRGLQRNRRGARCANRSGVHFHIRRSMLCSSFESINGGGVVETQENELRYGPVWLKMPTRLFYSHRMAEPFHAVLLERVYIYGVVFNLCSCVSPTDRLWPPCRSTSAFPASRPPPGPPRVAGPM